MTDNIPQPRVGEGKEMVRRGLAGYGGCDVMAEYRNTVSVMGLVVVVGN